MIWITPRQRAAWICVAQGLSRKELAAKLGLSRHTIEGHLERVYEKIGAHNAADAARLAVEYGLIPFTDRRADLCVGVRCPAQLVVVSITTSPQPPVPAPAL